jgi:hypothetical protein
MNGAGKLSPKDISNGLAQFTEGDSQAAKNMSKMLEFQKQKNISIVWSNGREKVVGPDFDHWKAPGLASSIRDGVARGGRSAGFMQEIVSDLDRGRISPFLGKIGKVSNGADGHTMDGSGIVVLRQGSHQIGIDKKVAERVRKAIVDSVEASAKGTPKKVVYADLWEKTGKTTWKSKDGWAATYAHEMGHQVHFAAGNPSFSSVLPEEIRKRAAGRGADAINAIGEMKAKTWKPSDYGNTNESERFAETFAQYVFAPDELKKASPEAYRWVDEAIKKAMQ